MKARSKIWNYLCYAGLSQEEYKSVKDRVGFSNWQMLVFGLWQIHLSACHDYLCLDPPD